MKRVRLGLVVLVMVMVNACSGMYDTKVSETSPTENLNKIRIEKETNNALLGADALINLLKDCNTGLGYNLDTAALSERTWQDRRRFFGNVACLGSNICLASAYSPWLNLYAIATTLGSAVNIGYIKRDYKNFWDYKTARKDETSELIKHLVRNNGVALKKTQSELMSVQANLHEIKKMFEKDKQNNFFALAKFRPVVLFVNNLAFLGYLGLTGICVAIIAYVSSPTLMSYLCVFGVNSAVNFYNGGHMEKNSNMREEESEKIENQLKLVQYALDVLKKKKKVAKIKAGQQNDQNNTSSLYPDLNNNDTVDNQ